MSLLPFNELPPYSPRKFVPGETDLGTWDRIQPLFEQLETRQGRCRTADELETWLLQWGELSAALDEEGSRRYIAMTCHTDHQDAEKAYLHFVEEIEPQIKPWQFKLSQLYLNHPARAALPPHRYHVFDRDTQVHVELFRPENVALETEESKLGQQYQKLSGSLTVEFRGQEQTLVQMARYLEEPDRPLRQEAWELAARRRLQEASQFEQIFDELFQRRRQIAAHAGLKDYREYAFRARCRFDYTPEDCLRFHQAVERQVVPALCELQDKRRRQMRLPALRPWDLAPDPLGRPPLRPFEQAEQLVAGVEAMFQEINPQLADQFRGLRELKLLDLDNRKGKAPGGYQSTLSEARLPFIFMNAVGVQRDVETLLHEAGHAFHSLAAQPEELYAYRHAPLEFCEVASMSMELVGNERLEKFYSSEDAARARREHLEGIIEVLPWIATVDAFQHWLYTHPEHSRAERTAAWTNLMERFGGQVDWSGYEEIRGHLWHRQLHLFLHPFYYIEYGIAQLGALQVWANFKADPGKALDEYLQALRLGGSRPLPELFSAAGCRFDFSEQTLQPLLDLLRADLKAAEAPSLSGA